MNETQMALGGIAALTGALGIVWAALASKISRTEQACEEDRKMLRQMLQSLVIKVNQLDRRRSDEFRESKGAD